MFGAGYRVCFGKEGDELVLLPVGGDKGSQRKDIAKAVCYWKDYKEQEDGKGMRSAGDHDAFPARGWARGRSNEIRGDGAQESVASVASGQG